MDEIFDRIKAIKIKRRYLIVGLISSELLGILVLIWFLRVPLSQKFLTTPPKAYSIETYSQQKRYLVQQGDFLKGRKALPNSKIAVFITPGNSKTIVKADNKGEFSYQLPTEQKLGRFRVTFANFDALKNLAWIKSYKVTVDSNNIFSKSPLFKNFQPKRAQAKDDILLNFVD